MHKSSRSLEAFKATPSPTSKPAKTDSQSACPYTPPAGARTPSASQKSSPPSVIAALNPLNYMPANLSQSRESDHQTIDLPIEREISTIPRADGGDAESGNWIYPSPQQMYNAMLRKGYTDTPQDAVTSMVAVHNFLNEGAWAEIVEWERRFGKGLMQGWRESRMGEEGSRAGAMIEPEAGEVIDQPKLLRFMGRADAMTPKAAMWQVMSWIYPPKFGQEPPFDRHDWYIERQITKDRTKEVRYVIDYYSGGSDEFGMPVFYLDIRPALDRPGAVAERAIRWGRDVWWRASGAAAREKPAS